MIRLLFIGLFFVADYLIAGFCTEQEVAAALLSPGGASAESGVLALAYLGVRLLFIVTFVHGLGKLFAHLIERFFSGAGRKANNPRESA